MPLTNNELENLIEKAYSLTVEVSKLRKRNLINAKLSGLNELELCLFKYAADRLYSNRNNVSDFIQSPDHDALYDSAYSIWFKLTNTSDDMSQNRVHNKMCTRDYLVWTFAKHGIYYTQACASLRDIEGHDFYDVYKLNKNYDYLFNLSQCNRYITTQAVFIEHGNKLLMCNKYGGSTYVSKGQMFRNMVYFNQTRIPNNHFGLGPLTKESKLDIRELIHTFATTEDLVDYCTLLELDIADADVLKSTLEPVFSDICDPTQLKIALDTFAIHRDARTFVNSVYSTCEIIAEELPTLG